MEHDPARYGDAMAAEYDARFGALSPDDAPIRFLAELADGGSVLELGIGTGRFALPLAATGLVVHGIDTSRAIVERMRAKPGGTEIRVAIADFREVPAPGDGYSLVYVVFNTIFALRTQDEQVAAFRATAARLRPGGSFVVEAFVPDLTRFDRGQRLGTQELLPAGVRIESSVHDAARQRIDTRELTITESGTSIVPISIRYAWPSELDLMARLAGLVPEARYGTWAKAPFGKTSTSHVSVFRKPAA